MNAVTQLKVVESKPVIEVIGWHDHVRPHMRAAQAERVALADSPRKVWYGVVHKGEVTAIAFLMIRKQSARIGGIYTHPQHRGNGYGDLLTRHLITLSEDRYCGVVDCYSVNPPYWQGLGFHTCGENAHGVTRLRKYL